MVRPPSFDSNGMKKGAWNEEEDNKLRACVQIHGHFNWRLVPILAGLARCGKSCRLRWVNYLKPGLRRGNFTKQEKDLIIKWHAQLGNKWSTIAANFPGRTDNEIKNYWHAHINKRSSNKRKRGGAVKVMRSAPMLLQEDQQSFELINFCNIATDHLQEEFAASKNVSVPQGLSVQNADNIINTAANSAAQVQDGLSRCTEEYQTCHSQLSMNMPPFAEEYQLYDHFELYQEMHNSNNSICSDSSDNAGIASWYSTAESQGNFYSEPLGEDAFYIALW